MKRGFEAEYIAYSWSQAGAEPEGWSFAFELEKNIKLTGCGFASPEERDLKAIEVADEFGICISGHLKHIKDSFQ